MSWILKAHASAGSGDTLNVTTAGVDTTGADLIVVAISDYLAVVATALSDSKGNTWTALTTRSNGEYARSRLFYCLNPTVGSGHTFTATNTSGGTPDYPSIAVEAWSGSSSFDKEGGAGTTSVTSIQPGALIPAGNNSLLVVAASDYNESTGASGGSKTIDSSFTVQEQTAYTPGTYFGASLSHFVQSTAASINPTLSFSGVTSGVAIEMAVFAGSGGGGGGARLSTLSLLGAG